MLADFYNSVFVHQKKLASHPRRARCTKSEWEDAGVEDMAVHSLC